MDPDKKKRLEAAGWRVGDASDFLGLSDVERQMIEVRLGLAKAVRAHREAKGMTQAGLAQAIGSSQSRVAKLESGSPDVSLDLILKCYLAVGGELPEEMLGISSGKSVARQSRVTRTVKVKA